MRLQAISLFLLLFSAITCGAVRAGEPGIDVTATVTRYSEYELTEHQTAILDEATKVSTASRVFYGLYGRWPKDIQELSGRTSGINYTLFNGNISLKTTTDGLFINVFDGKNFRQLPVKESMPLSDFQEQAQNPDFKIHVSLSHDPPSVA